MSEPFREIEIKFPVQDVGGMRARLEALGARSQGRVFEDNLIFDDEAGSVEARQMLLRLRRDGSNWLTVKRPIAHERYKIREEFEVGVADFARARALLEALGYHMTYRYQKWRETWQWGESKLLLDEAPFGAFLELEGTEETLAEMEQRLALDPAEGSNLSYRGLHYAWCQANGIPFGPAVFPGAEE